MPTNTFPAPSEVPPLVEDAAALGELVAGIEVEVDIEVDSDGELVVVAPVLDVVELWLECDTEICEVVLSGAGVEARIEVDLDDDAVVLFTLEA